MNTILVINTNIKRRIKNLIPQKNTILDTSSDWYIPYSTRKRNTGK